MREMEEEETDTASMSKRARQDLMFTVYSFALHLQPTKMDITCIAVIYYRDKPKQSKTTYVPKYAPLHVRYYMLFHSSFALIFDTVDQLQKWNSD